MLVISANPLPTAALEHQTFTTMTLSYDTIKHHRGTRLYKTYMVLRHDVTVGFTTMPCRGFDGSQHKATFEHKYPGFTIEPIPLFVREWLKANPDQSLEVPDWKPVVNI